MISTFSSVLASTVTWVYQRRLSTFLAAQTSLYSKLKAGVLTRSSALNFGWWWRANRTGSFSQKHLALHDGRSTTGMDRTPSNGSSWRWPWHAFWPALRGPAQVLWSTEPDTSSFCRISNRCLPHPKPAPGAETDDSIPSEVERASPK